MCGTIETIVTENMADAHFGMFFPDQKSINQKDKISPLFKAAN